VCLRRVVWRASILILADPECHAGESARRDVMAMSKKLIVPPGYELKFSAYRTDKNGKRIYAKWFGLKAWPLLVPRAK
jgi:hypothetical protein